MKLIKKLLIAIPVAAALFSYSVAAKNNVSEIAIDVTVRDDGSAYVVQNWTGEFNEGTENYIPINTSDIGISDFKVSDADGEYTFEDNWDIDADFDAKKRKCGINETDEGIELCFGISEYGENRYSIEYVVSDFIKSYSDSDGTNFMFINPNMSTFPTDGRITIVLDNGTPLNQENAAIWAFGFEGEIEFADGKINAYTTNSLEGDNSMIVMFSMDKGIITPETMVDESFEEVKNTAFEGSDYGYEEATFWEKLIGYIVLFGFFAAVFMIAAYFVKRKKEIKAFYKETGYFRDVPNGGDIEISHFLAQQFNIADNESLIIGALMLSMINKGCIEPQSEENIGMFGKSKKSVNMKLIKEPGTSAEKRLYKVLKAASGDDGILQEKELEKYAYKHPKSVNGIIDSAKSDGESEFVAEGGFVNGYGNRIKNLTETGKKELAEVIGLKKYLEEFSLIAEREINETLIWQDYMVYATLFGIADKVIKQFEKVYPDKIPEFENYNRNVVVAHSYYRSMHRSAERAEQQARTSGSGGRSSVGGGGGFSGGGSGGGSR